MQMGIVAVGAWLTVAGLAYLSGILAHYGADVGNFPTGAYRLWWASFAMANIGGMLFIGAFPRIKE